MNNYPPGVTDRDIDRAAGIRWCPLCYRRLREDDEYICSICEEREERKVDALIEEHGTIQYRGGFHPWGEDDYNKER